ncbi:MAG TPA: 6-phosphogluconolactonase [Chloroflexi bacterium]|nr:6-phosphogluconolactonase [Chloroflexota bacterium]HAL28194.1 6-phosphogluconolactonase [Chloroflexota bacterium]
MYPDAERLAVAAATIVAETLRSSPALRLVLAGGTTPKRCYMLLAAMGLSWARATVLFGDERCLPPLDPETNFQIASKALLRTVCPATVHRIPGELGPDEAAAAYEPIVAAAPLDLVLLGIGIDGHTASLFPGNDALRATGYVAGVRNAAKPPPERVTLTLRALHEAKRVVILAAGADKKDAVRRAFAGEVPAGMIDRAEWLVTADAR